MNSLVFRQILNILLLFLSLIDENPGKSVWYIMTSSFKGRGHQYTPVAQDSAPQTPSEINCNQNESFPRLLCFNIFPICFKYILFTSGKQTFFFSFFFLFFFFWGGGGGC